MRSFKGFGFVCLILFLLLSACSNEGKAEGEEKTKEETTEEEQQAASADPAEIELLDYGEKMGLELEAPASEEATTMPLKGEIDQADELNEDYLWVVLRKRDHIEEIKDKKFEYFIPIENGQFAKELNLHHGEGEYVVTVRLPSEEDNEEDTYYDAAEFTVDNLEDGIERDVELSKFGVENGLEMTENVAGWNNAEGIFEVSGTVGEDYQGKRLFAEVEKDSEKNHVVIPIEDGEFSGEVPLNYGEGTHTINLQLIDGDGNEDDALYYDSAKLYVNNESEKELPEFNEYEDYLDSGIMLETPAMDVDITQEQIEYPIKGKIDKDAPLAENIEYVIVSIEQMEDHDKATYYIPVEDYEFEDMTHFRFGPGEYEVTFNIPEPEQEEGPKYYYLSVLSLKHEVEDIDDKRDLLPSRGTESDDPVIIDKAEEITEGLDSEREKAKAIYEYVAKNIDYDVEKFDDDVFNPDDNAIDTLESGKGICQDYTFLTTALLRSVDIESRYIEGHAGARHAWVEAKVDGEWIELDPTWGAGYVDGDEFIAEYNEDYFDPEEDLMEETHTRQGVKY